MNNQERSNQKALIVKKIAERRGLTTNNIYKIIRGDVKNEDVVADYVDMNLEMNRLLKHVNETVPFYETSNS